MTVSRFVDRSTSVAAWVLIRLALVGGVLMTAVQAAAQGTPVKLVTLDLAVPDSPAFAILGLSPETVVRPASPRELATTVLNGVDKRGNLQSGLAVDLAPLFLFSGKTLTYRDYRSSRATQVYGRTQVSFATAKGNGDADKSLRLATGVRVTLWDAGDPRLDETLLKCLDDIPVAVPTKALLTQADRDAFVAKATADRRPAVEGCHKAFKAEHWNASSLAVGVAPSWQSNTGETADFSYAGAAVWASLALRLSRTTASSDGSPSVHAFGQLIVQGRYRNKELVPDKNAKGTFFEQDSSGVGARLLLGAADRAGVVETELSRQSPASGDTTTSFKLSGGGQLKLANDVWLSFTAGGTRGGPANEQRGGFVLTSLKWALSREPALKLP
jgi:hypothetical protein